MKRFGFGKKKDKDGSLAGKVVVVGPYSVRVESLVGEGGFATIYKAVDLKTGQTFALKHMRLAAEPDAIREVQHEAKTMARLKGHPNILKLHAVAFAGPQGAETDGFMLLDFCPTTLLEVMQRCGFALDDFLVHEVFQDVCWAVAHMHKCNPPLAHRDIKAENVLKNGEGRWVICDFGSSTSRAQVYDTAAEIAAEEEVIRRTTTPAYRSPEMWDLYSRQRIDTAVDVWALGVLLYVLSFGKLPFQGDSKLSILYGKYDMPAGRPAALRSLIQDMLQVNPADRPDIFQVISRLDVLRAVLSEAGASGGGSAPPAASQPPAQAPATLQRASAVGPAAAAGAAAGASAAAPSVLSDPQMSRSAHLPLGSFPPPTPGVSLQGHPSSHSYSLPPTSVSAHSNFGSAYAGPLRQQAPGQGPPPGLRGPLAAGLQDKAHHAPSGHTHPGGPQAAPFAAGPNAHHHQQGHQAAHLPHGPHATYHHPQQPQQPQQQAGGPQRPLAGRPSLQQQQSAAPGAANPAEFAVMFDLPPPGAVGPRPAPAQQAAAGAGPAAAPVSLMDEPLVVVPPSPATAALLDPPPAEWGNPAAPSAGAQPGPGLHTSGGAPPAQHLPPPPQQQQQQHPPRSQQPQHFDDGFGDSFFPQPAQPSQQPQPPQAPQPSQAPAHSQGRHRRHGSVGFGDDPVDWGDQPFAAEPPPAASQPPQQQPAPSQPPQQQPQPPAAQPLAPSTSHANGPIQPASSAAALHPAGQPPAARMGPNPAAAPDLDRPSLPPAAAAAVGGPVSSSKGGSSGSSSRPSSQQQLPVVSVAAVHTAADGLVSVPSAGGRRSLGGAGHTATSGDVVEALRAQVRQLSAHNASLEGRVAHLEELAASQGAALQRLAAELHALTRGQQQQQQRLQPAEPPHATSGVLARAGSSVGRPVSPGPAVGAGAGVPAPWGNGYGGDLTAGGVSHGAGGRPAAVPEQVLDEAAGGVGAMGSGLLSSTDSVGTGRDVVAGSAFGGAAPSWGGTPERISGPSASALYPPISYQDLA